MKGDLDIVEWPNDCPYIGLHSFLTANWFFIYSLCLKISWTHNKKRQKCLIYYLILHFIKMVQLSTWLLLLSSSCAAVPLRDCNYLLLCFILSLNPELLCHLDPGFLNWQHSEFTAAFQGMLNFWGKHSDICQMLCALLAYLCCIPLDDVISLWSWVFCSCSYKNKHRVKIKWSRKWRCGMEGSIPRLEKLFEKFRKGWEGVWGLTGLGTLLVSNCAHLKMK